MADPTTLIRDSWNAVRAKGRDDFALLFYAVLEDFSPQVGALFAGINMVRQRRKIMGMLDRVVRSATEEEDPEIGEALARLGADHRRFGTEISTDTYQVVGAALLYTLAHFVDGWTDDHRAAWEMALTNTVTVMLGGAGRAASGGVPPWIEMEIHDVDGSLDVAQLWVAVPPKRPPGFTFEVGERLYVSRVDRAGHWVAGEVGDVDDTREPPWVCVDVPVVDDDLDAVAIAHIPPGVRLRLAPRFEEAIQRD